MVILFVSRALLRVQLDNGWLTEASEPFKHVHIKVEDVAKSSKRRRKRTGVEPTTSCTLSEHAAHCTTEPVESRDRARAHNPLPLSSLFALDFPTDMRQVHVPFRVPFRKK